LVYDLAVKNPGCNFIYFHAKGMSHNLGGRSIEEITLFTKTFRGWRNNVKLLGRNGVKIKSDFSRLFWQESKQRSGSFGGWIWYNFWYATGEYISNCQKPLPAMNRYYYESWLAKHKTDECYITNDCKKHIQNTIHSIKITFTPSEADFYLSFPSKPKTTPQKIVYFLRSRIVAYWYISLKKRFYVTAKA